MLLQFKERKGLHLSLTHFHVPCWPNHNPAHLFHLSAYVQAS